MQEQHRGLSSRGFRCESGRPCQPPNALADEQRSFKPRKQVRFLTGASGESSIANRESRTGPPNALADERRSLKPEKQVRFLTGAFPGWVPWRNQQTRPPQERLIPRGIAWRCESSRNHFTFPRACGETSRHAGLRSRCRKACRCESCQAHFDSSSCRLRRQGLVARCEHSKIRCGRAGAVASRAS